jgi:hypothetical protein
MKQQSSEVKAHLFYVMILTKFQEMATNKLKKTKPKLKKALEITIASAMKVYLIHSWSGVVALNMKLSKQRAVDTVEQAGKIHSKLFLTIDS